MYSNDHTASILQNYLQGFRFGKIDWLDAGMYPVEERLSAATADEVAVVDIGGGVGHELEAIRMRCPSLIGRLVLQDQQEVIRQVPPGKASIFEAAVHDMFTPQPVIGALERREVCRFQGHAAHQLQEREPTIYVTCL